MTPSPKQEGILLVDKERGRTAFYLVKVLRKLTGIRKIGHAGILDPFATGVMVMLIGRSYTKLSDRFIGHDKEYEAIVKLGEATDTFDCDGTITSECSEIPSHEAIQEALMKFQGHIEQIPPMFSAKKVQGQKLYKLARQGLEIERKPIQIRVNTQLLEYAYPFLKLRIDCSKGTYIRSIAHDLGEVLGVGAHLTSLTRTRSGSFKLKDCIDAKSLSDPSFSYMNHLRKHA